MRGELSCICYKGGGKTLKKLRERTKRQSREMPSFIRLSTFQRVEVYSDEILRPREKMKFLDYPLSMQHLIEVLSGVDSGLFGEIEIYIQVKESLESAKKENHLSKDLEEYFLRAFEISEKIREKHKLNSSWINAIKKEISGMKKIHIYGDGSLAKSLSEFLSKDFEFPSNSKSAEAIIILKKGFDPSEFSRTAKIINLTEEEHENEEMKLKEFFTSPSKETLASIKSDIEENLSPTPIISEHKLI